MSSTTHAVLVIDDGELDGVLAALEDLEIGHTLLRGVDAAHVFEPPAELLIAAQKRALRLPDAWTSDAADRRPLRVAVLDEDSQSLRTRLAGLGFDFTLRRAVHPTELRLFLVRVLYGQGEPPWKEGRAARPARRSERRRHGRRAYPQGIMTRRDGTTFVAMARDLSRGGIRVEPIPEAKPGQELCITLFEEDREERPLVLRATVLRDDGDQGVALRFVGVGPEEATRIERLMKGLPAARALRADAVGAPGARIVSEVSGPS